MSDELTGVAANATAEAPSKLKNNWEWLTAIEQEMVDINEGCDANDREMNDEEKGRYDKLQKQHERRLSAVKRDNELLEMKAARALEYGPDPAVREPQGRAVPAAGTIGDPDPGAAAGRDNHGALCPFPSLSTQLVAVRNAEVGHHIDPRLGQLHAAITGMGGAVDADGGHMVQRDFADGLAKRTYETGSLLSFSPGINRIQIGPGRDGLKLRQILEDSRVDGLRHGGAQAFWDGEAETMTASQVKTRVLEMSLKKLTALVYITDELLQDAPALQQEVMTQFSQEFAFKIEDAIINGIGGDRPLGIFNSGALVAVAKETAQVAATLDINNISKIYARMWSRSKRNSVWLHNGDPFPQLISLKLGDHGIFLPAGNIAGTPFNMLLGRPMLELEYLPTIGQQGDITLADFTAYNMIEKEGLQGASSIHVRFLENETAFRFTWRLDGLSTWVNPLTPFKGSLTRSPFVTVAERS